MNRDLAAYIEEKIIPCYRNFDAAHQESHVRSVIKSSADMAIHYDVDAGMVYVVAAYHDIGLQVDRKTHHLESGRFVRTDKMLKQWFTTEQIETIAQAVEDHRASNKNVPRSIYGKLVAEADRQIESVDIVRRTIQFGLSNYPKLDKLGIWNRTLEHLHEKYAEGGYLKLWIPESENAVRLRKLQALIKDEKCLRELFENLYNELTA